MDEFELDIDMQDSLQDIYDQAYNSIIDGDVDYISEGETNRHYSSLNWADDKGYFINMSGEFVSSDEKKNTYYRKDSKGNFEEVAWYDHTEDDYIFMMFDIDTDGKKVAIVCK